MCKCHLYLLVGFLYIKFLFGHKLVLVIYQAVMAIRPQLLKYYLTLWMLVQKWGDVGESIFNLHMHGLAFWPGPPRGSSQSHGTSLAIPTNWDAMMQRSGIGPWEVKSHGLYNGTYI